MRRMLMVLATTGLLCGVATSVLAQARPVDRERGPRRGGFGAPPSEEMRGWFRSLPEEQRRKIMEKVGKLPPEERRAAIEKLARKYREKGEQPERRGRFDGRDGERAAPGHGPRHRRGGGEQDRAQPQREAKRPAARTSQDTRRPAARPQRRGDDALRAYFRHLPKERREQLARRLRGATPEVRAKFRQRVAESMRKGGEGRRPGMERRHHGGERRGRMAGQRRRGDCQCGRSARGPGHGRSQGMRGGARHRTAREDHRGRHGRGRMAMRRGDHGGGRGEFRGRMGRGGMRGPATPGHFGGRQDRMGLQGQRLRGPQGQRFRGPARQSFRGPQMQTPVRRGGWHDRGRGNRGQGFDRDWMSWR